MNRTLLTIKQTALSTSLGKKMRKIRYRSRFTRERAIEKLSEFGLSPTDELVSDMMNEALEHDVTFREYFMYHFYDLKEKERREFIPLWEAGSKYVEVFNNYRTSGLFYDKEKVYNRFKQFYKRKLIALHRFNEQEKTEFYDLFSSAGRVIVKPYDGQEGFGIRMINYSADSEDVFEKLRHDYPHGAIIEEVVEQDERMASLHPESLNTLRIATVRLGDEVIVLPPLMRVGTNGSVVDNGGSGGIFCELDENGVITNTCDEKGQSFEYHPTTHKKLIGFQVPDISKAVELAKQLSAVCPEVTYIGWDIALSKNGFVMIEGNSAAGFVVWQIFGKGCRPLMDSIMDRVKEGKNK